MSRKKEPTDMKDILKELSCLRGKKVNEDSFEYSWLFFKRCLANLENICSNAVD